MEDLNQIKKIEELAQTKSFEQLSEQEKNLVLHYMKEEEFDSMVEFYKNLNNSAYSIANDIEPDAEIKHQLIKSYENRKESNLIIQAISYKIPAYGVVAAAVIIVLFLNSFFTKTIIYPNAIHDTIQIVKYIHLPDSLNIKKMVENEKTDLKLKSNKPENRVAKNNIPKITRKKERNSMIEYQQQLALNNLQKAKDEKSGRNFSQDSVLGNFLVTTY